MVRFTLPLLCILLFVFQPASGQTLPPEARLVMSHFKADLSGGDERLFISWSPDGLNWTCLNGGQPVWQPPGWAPFANVVRDPAIIYANGFYWVAFTSGTYGKGNHFGLVKSADLLNWTFVVSVDATLPGATDQLTWNPVFFEDGDGSIHATIAISPTGGSQLNPVPNMRVHEIHPINADWTQWSVPTPLELPDPNTNEGWIWKEGDTYHIQYVSFSRNGQLIHATSKNLVTGWLFHKVLGFPSQEGGMMLPIPEGGYRLYLEKGNGAAEGYFTCDFDQQFSIPTPQVQVNASVPMRNGKMCAARGTTSYAQWQSTYLATAPAGRRGPLEDADDDGFANVIEHSMGTDPLTNTVIGTPYLRTVGGELYPGVTYESSRAATDVTSGVELKIGDGPWINDPSETLVESVTLLSNGSMRSQRRATQPLVADPVLFRYSASLVDSLARLTLPAQKAPSLKSAAKARKPAKTPRR